MNKKQLITMWTGIATIVLVILWRTWVIYLCERLYTPMQLWRALLACGELPVIATAATVGLIFTFADKKDKRPKDEQNNK